MDMIKYIQKWHYKVVSLLKLSSDYHETLSEYIRCLLICFK